MWKKQTEDMIWSRCLLLRKDSISRRIHEACSSFCLFVISLSLHLPFAHLLIDSLLKLFVTAYNFLYFLVSLITFLYRKIVPANKSFPSLGHWKLVSLCITPSS